MAPRAVVLVHDMPSHPPVQSYQVSLIYLKGCRSYCNHKDSITKYCQGRELTKQEDNDGPISLTRANILNIEVSLKYSALRLLYKFYVYI